MVRLRGRGPGPLAVALVVLTAASAFAAPNGTHVPAPPQVVPVPVPVPAPSYCWVDIRLFYTLRLGPVPVCRRHLRYRPGALECYQFLDNVCATFLPTSGWVQSRSPISTDVVACPDGPEPPVCRAFDLPALP